jgi:hypothetical protein
MANVIGTFLENMVVKTPNGSSMSLVAFVCNKESKRIAFSLDRADKQRSLLFLSDAGLELLMFVCLFCHVTSVSNGLHFRTHTVVMNL